MKQFLLLIDEACAGNLASLIPSIKFLEVQGMPMEGGQSHVLVTPIIPPVPPAPPVVPTEPPVTDEVKY